MKKEVEPKDANGFPALSSHGEPLVLVAASLTVFPAVALYPLRFTK